MKQRLLVMNGQKIVQSEIAGKWATHKVDKAGGIPPGIYNIHLATVADKALKNDGVILHVDGESVIQKIGMGAVKYDVKDFAKIPEVGSVMSVKYEAGVAMATPSTLTHSRKLSR